MEVTYFAPNSLAWFIGIVLQGVHEQVRQVEVGKEKDHLVKSGLPNVPNKHEGYDYGQGSMMLGDPLELEHDWVVGERDIEDPARCGQ